MKDKKILIGTVLLGILGLFLYLAKRAKAEEPPLIPQPPLTPGTGRLYGSVTEGGNQNIPVPDVLVQIDGLEFQTGADGKFEVWVPVGTYTITVSKEGYGRWVYKKSILRPGYSAGFHVALGPW